MDGETCERCASTGNTLSGEVVLRLVLLSWVSFGDERQLGVGHVRTFATESCAAGTVHVGNEMYDRGALHVFSFSAMSLRLAEATVYLLLPTSQTLQNFHRGTSTEDTTSVRISAPLLAAVEPESPSQ